MMRAHMCMVCCILQKTGTPNVCPAFTNDTRRTEALGWEPQQATVRTYLAESHTGPTDCAPSHLILALHSSYPHQAAVL